MFLLGVHLNWLAGDAIPPDALPPYGAHFVYCYSSFSVHQLIAFPRYLGVFYPKVTTDLENM